MTTNPAPQTLHDLLTQSRHQSLTAIAALARAHHITAAWDAWHDLDQRLHGRRSRNQSVTIAALIRLIADRWPNRVFQHAIDPWAGAGLLLSGLVDQGVAASGRGICVNEQDLQAAQTIAGDLPITWVHGDPLEQPSILAPPAEPYDLIVAVPPWNGRNLSRTVELPSGEQATAKDRTNHILLLDALHHLAHDGEALFFVPSGFFSTNSRTDVRQHLDRLGYHIKAAIDVPRHTLVETSLPGTLLVINRHPAKRVFVAQYPDSPERYEAFIRNLTAAKNGPDLGLGRLLPAADLRPYPNLEADDRLHRHLRNFPDLRPVPMAKAASAVNMGRHGPDFAFTDHDNAVYLPLLGPGPAVTALHELSSKPQNYAQIVLDPAVAHAEYVAQLFNSELGQILRQTITSGAVIPRTSKSALLGMKLYLPDLDAQRELVSTVRQLHNTRAELNNTLAEMEQKLWQSPAQAADIRRTVTNMVREESFTEWLDTLPFPLATILWTYSARPGDSKRQFELLLKFFEAFAEFMATIHLSALQNDSDLFETEKKTVHDILAKNGMSLEVASFGTWKVINERVTAVMRKLGKTSRDGELDPRLGLYRMPDARFINLLCSTEIVQLISHTTNLRNEWLGHDGIVSVETAAARHDELRSCLSELRRILGLHWSSRQLIQPIHMQYANGSFIHRISYVTGRSTPFVESDDVRLSHPLETGTIYLWDSDSTRALPLMPFFRVMPSPSTAQNACYFFVSLKGDVLRHISYHFEAESEVKESYPEVLQALRRLRPRDN